MTQRRVAALTRRDHPYPTTAAQYEPGARPTRDLRQPVQPVAFLGEHHRRRPAGDPVLTRVRALAELQARGLERREVLVRASRKLRSVGTRSAFAILTVASLPRLLCGSHLAIVRP